MRNTPFAFLVRYVAIIFFLVSTGHSQSKPRIAVFPFDDRTTANKDMNIGTKVADLLITKLTANGTFVVYDRQYIDRILAEKDRKYDPNYDSSSAAKAGLLGTVDMVISGQIVAFSANTNQVASGKYLTKRVETDGTVELKITARFISVEQGSILLAPSANSEEKGVLAKSDTVAPLVTNRLPGKGGLDVNQEQATSNTEQALRKLVDEAADDVTKQLAAEVAQTATSMPMTSAHAPEAPTKTDTHVSTSVSKILFVGISEGLAYIDKGSEAGIKVGQKFTIRRSVDTGLKNGAGEPVIRHKAVCALTISTVEDSSAAGKCIPDPTAHGADGIPRTGDEVVAETR